MQMKVPKVMRPVPQCMKIHQVVYCHEKRKMILRKISCTTCCSSQLDTCEKCQLEGVPAILLLLHIQCYKSTEISRDRNFHPKSHIYWDIKDYACLFPFTDNQVVDEAITWLKTEIEPWNVQGGA
uniref:Uncharacterized protein n=1 Tax=Cacopsylla melanoneura TaxID=428564 RepID=A0A8D9BG77_9HEMI